jgi:hypothetical protein
MGAFIIFLQDPFDGLLRAFGTERKGGAAGRVGQSPDNAASKTHVALTLGLAACQKGLAVGFTTVAALVNELHESRDEKGLLSSSMSAR